MLFDIGIFMLLFYLTIPAVLGYCASTYGKKFWPWFIYGCFFPGISQFHLITVLYLEDRKRKKELKMTFEEEKYMSHLIGEALSVSDPKSKKSR